VVVESGIGQNLLLRFSLPGFIGAGALMPIVPKSRLPAAAIGLNWPDEAGGFFAGPAPVAAFSVRGRKPVSVFPMSGSSDPVFDDIFFGSGMPYSLATFFEGGRENALLPMRSS